METAKETRLGHRAIDEAVDIVSFSFIEVNTSISSCQNMPVKLLIDRIRIHRVVRV